MPRLSPRRQGDLGELSAMEWFASQGYAIYVPVGHSPTCDFIAERQHKLLRVQVKTSTRFTKDRWVVAICTRGGNRSWSGVVKRLDPAHIDYLFVVVGDGRRGQSQRARSVAAPASFWAARSMRTSRLHPAGCCPRKALADRYHRAPWRGSRAVKGDAL